MDRGYHRASLSPMRIGYVARAHFPGLDPGIAQESRRLRAEEVVPLLSGA
jgi:hypothetical protein